MVSSVTVDAETISLRNCSSCLAVFANAHVMRVCKDRQARAAVSQTNGFGINGDGRHHARTESSGEEDKPLEISMTKMNQRRSSNQPSPPLPKQDTVLT